MVESKSDQLVRLLASLIKRPSIGDEGKIVLFLGAGAPVHAPVPVPTASQLKNQVISEIWEGEQPPTEVQSGTLEDLMEYLTLHAKGDGYLLVADRIMAYDQPPAAYDMVMDLVNRNFISGIVTTNFDVLLEIAASRSGISKLRFLWRNEDYDSTMELGQVPVLLIHGSAKDSSTMRGSWSELHSLPANRASAVNRLITGHITIFVGYAGGDEDVRGALRGTKSSRPVFWVDIGETPTDQIRDILEWLGSADNYIVKDVEEFFKELNSHLTVPPSKSDRPDLGAIATRLGKLELYPEIKRNMVMQRASEDRNKFRDGVRRKITGSLQTLCADINRQGSLAERTAQVVHIDFDRTNIKSSPYDDLISQIPWKDPTKLWYCPLKTGPVGLPCISLVVFVVGEPSDFLSDIKAIALILYMGNIDYPGGLGKVPSGASIEVWNGAELPITWLGVQYFAEIENWLNHWTDEYLKDIDRYIETVHRLKRG